MHVGCMQEVALTMEQKDGKRNESRSSDDVCRFHRREGEGKEKMRGMERGEEMGWRREG